MQVSITLEPALVEFYSRIAKCSGRQLEQVLEDALFRLAGELSFQAICAAQTPTSKKCVVIRQDI